jgi:hypothetical protein
VEPKGSSALGEELTVNNNMYEQMLTTKSLIVGLFIVTIVSPSHLQPRWGGLQAKEDRIKSRHKKCPTPATPARVGQIQGGFNRIGYIRGLSKPYPFNSITWKYTGVNRYKAK